jgi:hypothetical protein
MRPLSASEAIGPALERTQDLLTRPFRFKTFLKIAAVAFFAEMGGNFNSNFSNLSNHSGNGAHGVPPALLAFLVAFAVIIGLISLVIGLILLYIGSRLQLVLIEMVANRQTYVGPLWRKYGATVWRWIGLKLLFFLGILVITLPLTIPVILFFVHRAHAGGGNLFSGLHIAQMILYFSGAFLVLLVIGAIYLLVRDLALPFLALENRGIRDSLERLRAIVAAEPGQILLYVFLRMLLGFVFGFAAEFAVVVILLISLIPPGIIGFILWFALHGAGAGGIVVLIALGVFAGLLFVCWAACVIICFVGAALVFGQAYALYFLGGRFPLLGDLLDRSTPPPVYTYSPIFPPAYPPPAAPTGL